MITPADLDQFITEDLALRREAHQLRSRRVVEPLSSTHVRIDGAEFVNFASNNYLGLTHHRRILAAAERSLRSDGLGSGAAALITGYTPRHAVAETAIARWKGTDDAVLLPSGYQANHAAVQTLAALGEKRGGGGGGTRFLIDKLAHASLLDAVRATSAEFRVFPHNHLSKLERLLADAPAEQLQVVLTESIFSMDGDAADLRGLTALKAKYPFILLLDEAHGSGVYGPNGAGYAAEQGMQSSVDVSVVTLSKALGCVGGAVCGTRNFCAALLNYGRAFIYSTAIPPMIAAAGTEAIRVMAEEPQRQARVRALARRVRESIAGMGLPTPPGDSPIVPIVLGDESRALAASQRLLEGRLLAPAVRPPTVPRGASRLRLTLSCDHTDVEVQKLLDILTAVIRQLGA
jgi:8-amino-7-oxononanoate synthase